MNSGISGASSPTANEPPFFPHPAIINARAAIFELESFLTTQSFLAQQSQQNLHTSCSEAAELEAQNTELKAQNTKLGSEVSALTAQVKELLAKVAAQDSELSPLRLTTTNQASKIKELTDGNPQAESFPTYQDPSDAAADSQLQALVSHQVDEISNLRDTVLERGTEIRGLEGAIGELRNGERKSSHRVGVRDGRILELEEESRQGGRLVKALQRTLVMNVLRSRDVEITKLRERHRRQALEIVDLRRRLTHTNERILRLEATIQAGVTVEGELERQLDATQSQLERTQEQLARTQARIISRMEELIRGFDELCAVERKQVVMNIPELRVQVARMKNDLEEERRRGGSRRTGSKGDAGVIWVKTGS